RLLQRGGLGSGLQPVEARPALVGGRRGACASLLDAVLDAVGDAVRLHELAAPLGREGDAPALLAAGEGPARASGQAGADLQAAGVHLDAGEGGGEGGDVEEIAMAAVVELHRTAGLARDLGPAAGRRLVETGPGRGR